jgi:hypothetical protein
MPSETSMGCTNLSELGVRDNVIQQILRHGDEGTTERFYRKTRRPALAKAMKKLKTAVSHRQAEAYNRQITDSIFIVTVSY